MDVPERLEICLKIIYLKHGKGRLQRELVLLISLLNSIIHTTLPNQHKPETMVPHKVNQNME